MFIKAVAQSKSRLFFSSEDLAVSNFTISICCDSVAPRLNGEEGNAAPLSRCFALAGHCGLFLYLSPAVQSFFLWGTVADLELFRPVTLLIGVFNDMTP
jgi:hypothetical protein